MGLIKEEKMKLKKFKLVEEYPGMYGQLGRIAVQDPMFKGCYHFTFSHGIENTYSEAYFKNKFWKEVLLTTLDGENICEHESYWKVDRITLDAKYIPYMSSDFIEDKNYGYFNHYIHYLLTKTESVSTHACLLRASHL